MKSNEANRRRDICTECLDFKPIKARGCCQNCHHKYKRKHNKRFYLSTRYTEIKQRCTNPRQKNNYLYNGKLNMTREDFLKRFINDKNFIKLFKTWEESGYDLKLSPSVDRIDNNGYYEISNIQFITHSQNCTKDQEKTPINVYKNGKLIATYESQGLASRELNVPQSNIWKVLNKQRKTAKGYYYEYA